MLRDEGADVNARTHHDETPLMEAVDHGHDRVAELLIKNKADVNAVTVSGKTAMHGAHVSQPSWQPHVRTMHANSRINRRCCGWRP